MPSMTVLPASSRSWGLACAFALGTTGTIADLLQEGMERRAREIANGDVSKITYMDTGRKEEWDEHRKSLIEEMALLKSIVDGDADEDAAVPYTPWEFYTP